MRVARWSKMFWERPAQEGSYFLQMAEAEEGGLPKAEKAKKLPYFHRTLSAEDTALIGDIAPKRIDSVDECVDGRRISNSSAWNSAGTWEERNCTEWSKETIKKRLSGISCSNDKYDCVIEECTSVEGHASIASVRGKPRFLFEFEEIKLKFEVTVKDDLSSSYEGELKIAGNSTRE